MKKLLLSNTLAFLFLFLLSFLIYFPLYFTFYQQDEWQAVGHMLAQGILYVWYGINPIRIILSEGRPLGALLNYFLFQSFPYNVTLIATYAIVLHTINSVLVYIIVKYLYKKKYVAFLSALFFLSNSVANQAIIWFGTSAPTLTATFFVLSSFLFFIKYLEDSQVKYLLLTFIPLLLSLYFKEIGIVFFVGYILLDILLSRKKKTIKYFILTYMPIFVGCLFFVGIRMYTLFSAPQQIGAYTTGNNKTFTIFLSNIVLYTLTIIPQMLVPVKYFFAGAKKFLIFLYPSQSISDNLTQTLGHDFIFVFLTCVFTFFLLPFIFRNKENKNLLLAIFFVVCSFLPYVLIIRTNSYLESRYYYLPAVGLSLLIAYLLSIVRKRKFLVASLFLLFLGWHITFTLTDLQTQVDLSKPRMSILQIIKRQIPSLKKNTVIYIESDTDYVVSHNSLPFQQGSGYTMLTWLYNPQSILQKKLLIENYLWDMGSQGYQREGSEGFGFFTDKNELYKSVKINSIQAQDVYGFAWNSKLEKLENITQKLRNEVKYIYEQAH